MSEIFEKSLLNFIDNVLSLKSWHNINEPIIIQTSNTSKVLIDYFTNKDIYINNKNNKNYMLLIETLLEYENAIDNDWLPDKIINLNYTQAYMFLKKIRQIILEEMDDNIENKLIENYKIIQHIISLSHLADIIQWSGLKTVEEMVDIIVPICESNQEYLEYKTLFENLKQSVNDENLKDTLLPNELVSKILDDLGMVVFYRKDSNILSSLSYEQTGSKLRLYNEWSKYIRENGFEKVLDYNYEDETIMRTSDALMKYGFEKTEKVYERTRVEL